MYNSKPGFYLFTGPDWNGKIHDGIVEVYKCSTALGFVAPRVFQTDDPVDKAAVQPLINQINMYPLSELRWQDEKYTDWTKNQKHTAGQFGEEARQAFYFTRHSNLPHFV
jgi:hypothetical protein